jgi:L-threonylcarbamoyladenylate synthase
MSENLVEIVEALKAFKEGRLVAIPTETVYGLAAPLNRLDLIQKIFELKKRPINNPLIVHVSSIQMAKKLSSFWPDYLDDLLAQYWPGPLSVLVPKNQNVPDLVTASLPLVALRMPKSKLTLSLIDQLQSAIVAPSANPYMKVSPTKPEHVESYFSSDGVYVLDGGPCDVGIESTIVRADKRKITLVRKGTITSNKLELYCNSKNINFDISTNGEAASPGQHERHYQPHVPLVVFKNKGTIEQALNELQKVTRIPYSYGCEIFISTDSEIAAKNLYQTFHQIDQNAKFVFLQLNGIVDRYPAIWEGVWDRIKRAATIVVE